MLLRFFPAALLFSFARRSFFELPLLIFPAALRLGLFTPTLFCLALLFFAAALLGGLLALALLLCFFPRSRALRPRGFFF